MSSPRPEIDVAFSVEDGVPAQWDEARIAALVRSIVARERAVSDEAGIALHLVSDATIRALNREHRSRDAVTDVLSFPLVDGDAFALPPGEMTQLGDVVVSYARAAQQALDYGHSIEREVAYLVAHGVLHILGYDHEDPEDQKVMRQREEAALEPLGYTRSA
jgi:probable rRNA maturation factor